MATTIIVLAFIAIVVVCLAIGLAATDPGDLDEYLD